MSNRAAPAPPTQIPTTYQGDFLRTELKSLDFLVDPKFRRAYQRGMNSGHHIGRPPGSTEDIHVEFRVYMLLWAAQHALHVPGNFVECGVNTGMCSLAICDYLGWNELDRHFYLLDTFQGIPEEQMLPRERQPRTAENQAFYSECFARAEDNFRPFQRTHLIRGKVPDTLDQVPDEPIAYLHLDMNIALPEVHALAALWPRVSAAGVVMLDDYGWAPYRAQKVALDELTATLGVPVATLPTGQGLIIKPPPRDRAAGERLRGVNA